MKTKVLMFLVALSRASPLSAADKNDKKPAGPDGGRVIVAVEPRLEFLVTKERKVEISALSEDLKASKMAAR